MREFFSVKEVAERLGLSGPSVYRLVASGRLPCHRMGPSGRRLLVRLRDLEEYAAKTRVAPRPGAPAPPAGTRRGKDREGNRRFDY